MCSGPTCTNVSSHLYLVEERLLEALSAWLEDYKVEIEQEKENKSEVELIERALIECDNELITLKKQLNNLHDLLEQEIYTTDKFLERSKLIDEKNL